MKSQKLFWCMLLACGLVLQVSCSQMEMERADSGGKVTAKSENIDNGISSYWDGMNKEVHVQFAHEIGTVQASVLDAKGGTVYGSAIESNVTSHSIKLSQLPSGDYIITMSNSKGSKTSLAFSIP